MKLVIGLEIHVQLDTQSKLFCGCSNDSFEALPNTNICPVCTGQPGALPVPNKKAIEHVITAGLAFNSEIPKKSKFDRKNYFYPDLPKGYQISQFDQPLCEGGVVEIEVEGEKKSIRLRRIHLEEDAGKLVHPVGADYSLVDYNRGGTPLAEVVSEPDINSPEEAVAFARTVQEVMRYVGVSQADMEKGHMRFDLNLSIQDENGEQLSQISEVKNLNSFRSLQKAAEFEYARHIHAIENGESLAKETRGWLDDKEETVSQRSKEEAHDYRYFPEPDIPTMVFDTAFVSNLKRALPELPEQRRSRYKEEYQLSDEDIAVIVSDKELGDFFESVASEVIEWVQSHSDKKISSDENRVKIVKVASNWLLSELLGLLKADKVSISKVKITPENFAELVSLVFAKEVNSSAGQTILKEMYETGNDPSHIMNEKGLKQVDDIDELSLVCDAVIKENPVIVEQIKAGKESAVQFLMGQVMKKTQGSANPQKAVEILKEKLL